MFLILAPGHGKQQIHLYGVLKKKKKIVEQPEGIKQINFW